MAVSVSAMAKMDRRRKGYPQRREGIMKTVNQDEIEAPTYCMIADEDGDPEATIYLIGQYLVTVPEAGRVTYRKTTESGDQFATPDAQLLEAAKEALEYLTDHGIDLEGEEEELVAGIRLRLDEAISAT
jgi:hypothetical protein